MTKLSRKSLILILALVAVLTLGAALTASLIMLPDNDIAVEGNEASAATVTAASSFGRMSTGAKYYFSNPTGANGSTAITISNTAAWGSQTNPYVISTIQQWQLFINVTNANNTTYNAAGKYFVLGSDLNFGGAQITPACANTTGFKGVLYGNKHTIKSAAFIAITNPAETARRSAGLFQFINGGAVYDLTIDSTCSFNFAHNLGTYVGGISVYTSNATLVDVHVAANILVNNSGVATGDVPI